MDERKADTSERCDTPRFLDLLEAAFPESFLEETPKIDERAAEGPRPWPRQQQQQQQQHQEQLQHCKNVIPNPTAQGQPRVAASLVCINQHSVNSSAATPAASGSSRNAVISVLPLRETVSAPNLGGGRQRGMRNARVTRRPEQLAELTRRLEECAKDESVAVSRKEIESMAMDILKIRSRGGKINDPQAKKMKRAGFLAGEIAIYRYGMLPPFALRATALHQEAPEPVGEFDVSLDSTWEVVLRSFVNLIRRAPRDIRYPLLKKLLLQRGMRLG